MEDITVHLERQHIVWKMGDDHLIFLGRTAANWILKITLMFQLFAMQIFQDLANTFSKTLSSLGMAALVTELP